MSAIPCKTVRMICSGTAGANVPLSRLIEGIQHEGQPLTEEHISDPRGQVSWTVVAEIVERMRDELGGDDALRKIGDNYLSTESFNIIRRIGRALSSPKDIYYLGARWAGPSLLPVMRAEMSELEDGRIVQTLTLNEPHRDCPAMFHLIHGVLINSPRPWGHSRSRVHLDLEPRRGVYTIECDQSGRGQIGRIFRALTVRTAYPTMLSELERQQSALETGYKELHHAHDRIGAQAADLERVNTIGKELAEDINLDHLADSLLRVLLEDLELAGAELWLVRENLPPATSAPASHSPDQGSPIAQDEPPERSGDENLKAKLRFFRRDGTTANTADHTYDLEAAGRPLGALHIWLKSGRNDQRRSRNEALLGRLLPWISIALDNARSYEAIERHAADLEERVKERTARLLTANHHLVREIDERRRTTEALLASEAQLRASERLASIGTLAAGIAHEINNPIGSILAAAQFAQVTRNDPDGNQQVDHALTDIVNEAKRCGGIVRSILQFSRDERTEKWPCRVSDIVRRSIRLTSGFSETNDAIIELEDLGGEEPPLQLDLSNPVPITETALRLSNEQIASDKRPWSHVNPIQIEQALVNLFRNAIEAGAKRVDVQIRHDIANEKTEICVADDGPGIPTDDLHRIFEPFYTTKQDIGGTGLGLSVVHGIATEHGGELRLQPSSSGGTVAIFELPTCPPPPIPIDETAIRGSNLSD